jgi:hypothetical protein
MAIDISEIESMKGSRHKGQKAELGTYHQSNEYYRQIQAQGVGFEPSRHDWGFLGLL